MNGGVSVQDPGLSAVIVRRWALRYAEGLDETLDRPEHVRSGSGLVRIGRRLVIVQDDACFLALYDLDDGSVRALTLPEGPGGRRQFDSRRGNKMDKLDLEAAVPLGEDGMLAFGSGSAPGRDRVLLVRGLDGDQPQVRLIPATPLYEALRAEAAFAGSELNVEGAAWDGGRMVLLNRGNGARKGDLLPVNASCTLDRAALLRWLEDPSAPVPTPGEVRTWDLGAVGGVLLTFTDAAASEGALAYLAAAEDSPDAIDDGPVAGVCVGTVAGDAGRYALLREADGTLVTDKAEGLALDPEDRTRGWVVFDLDDPERPTEMAEIRLLGPWFG